MTLASDIATRYAEMLADVAAAVAQHDDLPPGGALIGPRLFFLAAFDRLADDRLVRLGSAIELLRRATLVHRSPKVELAWPGHGATPFSQTLRGDTLLAASFQILAQDGEPRTVQILSRAMARVAEGELTENPDDAVARRVAFFESAAETGLLVADVRAGAGYPAWVHNVGEAHERRRLGAAGSLLLEAENIPMLRDRLAMVEDLIAHIGTPDQPPVLGAAA